MDSQDLMAEAQSFSAESPLKLANQAMKDSLAAASASAPDNTLAQNEQVEKKKPAPPPPPPPPPSPPSPPLPPETLPQPLIDLALSFYPSEERQQEKENIKKIRNFSKLPPSTTNLIVFSVFGDNPKYTQGLVHNINLQKVLYPEWKVRIYVANNVPSDKIEEYKSLGAEVVPMNKDSVDLHGALWRFLGTVDPNVDRFIIRDADSRLNSRERFAVQKWIESGKSLHVMRDHPNHDYAVNAGMWGGVRGVVTKELLEKTMGDLESTGRSEYGDDQRFLRDVVYGLWKNDAKDDVSQHDSYSCGRWGADPFPTKRSSNLQHVGQVFDGENRPRMGDITCCMTRKKSPDGCRLENAWEWG
ncbi:hypothetical protein ScalyP_jg5120 [Parmales sp. scaly parma]|nr:hypothetical protein ScalyP_jg5120 [Parmales sp. scaly parma]